MITDPSTPDAIDDQDIEPLVVLALTGDHNGIVGFHKIKLDVDRDGHADCVEPDAVVELTGDGTFFCMTCCSTNRCPHLGAAASIFVNAVTATITPAHAEWLAKLVK
jgi:hypothetical protein